jgi:hypothetical protein
MRDYDIAVACVIIAAALIIIAVVIWVAKRGSSHGKR